MRYRYMGEWLHPTHGYWVPILLSCGIPGDLEFCRKTTESETPAGCQWRVARFAWEDTSCSSRTLEVVAEGVAPNDKTGEIE